MAVEVPDNRVSKITFTYKTPGLKAGIIISAGAIVIFIVYMVLITKFGKNL